MHPVVMASGGCISFPQPPRYRCPIHGDIGSFHVALLNEGQQLGAPFCIHCIAEVMERFGVFRVEKIEE